MHSDWRINERVTSLFKKKTLSFLKPKIPITVLTVVPWYCGASFPIMSNQISFNLLKSVKEVPILFFSRFLQILMLCSWIVGLSSRTSIGTLIIALGAHVTLRRMKRTE